MLKFFFLYMLPHTVQLCTFSFSFCRVVYGSDTGITGRPLGKHHAVFLTSRNLGIIIS